MGDTAKHLVVIGVALLLLCLLTGMWVAGSAARLSQVVAEKEGVATASAADEGYCTGPLKVILRRVLTSCGLVKGGSQRGCQPLQARNVAAMGGDDFNALFLPLADRAAIIQFDQDSADLDAAATELLDTTFADQRGASYFLVVSRASPEGSVEYNRELSRRRADTVLNHLRTRFSDPDLDQEVGLLWLGKEFAQLDKQFCTWRRSRSGGPCSRTELNRSAFVAWIDCRL